MDFKVIGKWQEYFIDKAVFQTSCIKCTQEALDNFYEEIQERKRIATLELR